MSKILTVLTGGTIGSISNGAIIDTNKQATIILLEKYFETFGTNDEFVTVQPINILSENLEIKHWEIIVNFICEHNLDGYDGIIITHGSDTLSYSSAMLSMCLCHLPIPVIIVAANYTVTDERSNALNNFRSAVSLIKTFSRGVFTVFGEKVGKSRVFLPTRILEADGLTDTFQSFGGGELGFVDGKSFIFTPLDINPNKYEIELKRNKIFTGKLSLSKKVMIIRQYPGLDFENIPIGTNIGAVLLITYHSQTARTQGNGSAVTLIKQCHKYGIDVYCSPFKKRGEYYKTSVDLLNLGYLPLYAISPESAYAKLLLACNIDNRLLEQNIYFEEII